MATRTLTVNALLVALTAVATLVIRFPTPATQGYLNLGDAVIFVAALCFGPRAGALAGGIGSSMADLLGGYPHWAPFTLLIKGTEGAVTGLLCRPAGPRKVLRALLSVIAGGLCMVTGYFAVETFLYGLGPAVAGVPGNGLQAVGGILVGLPAASALVRSGLAADS